MPKTILLADDSVTIQKVVGISFANEDVVLLTVDNGDDALNRARESHPDIVLADIVMPGMSGYEVCAAMRADSELRQIPVLLLSGTFETFDEERARDVGADGHITKPFEAQALVDQVNELLARTTPDPFSAPDTNSRTAVLEPAASEAYDFFDDDMAAGAPDLGAMPEATPVAETTLLVSDANDDSAVGQVFDLEPLDDSQRAESFDDVPLAEPVIAAPTPRASADAGLAHSEPADAGYSLGDAIGAPDDDDAFGAPFESEEVLASSSGAFSFDGDSFGGTLPSDTSDASYAAGGDDGADLFGSGDSMPGHQASPSAPAADPLMRSPDVGSDSIGDAGFATQTLDASDSWSAPLEDAESPLPAVDAFDAPPPAFGAPKAIQSEPQEEAAPVAFAAAPVADERVEPTAIADETDALPVMPLALQERVHETLERIAWEAMGDLSERVVKEALNRIEAIAWEVIPQMAETLIREEIDRMKDGDDS